MDLLSPDKFETMAVDCFQGKFFYIILCKYQFVPEGWNFLSECGIILLNHRLILSPFGFIVRVLVDVTSKSSNIGVNTGISLLSASVAPRNDSSLSATDGQRATGVSLAGVSASGTSADHSSGNITAVGTVACSAGDDRNWHGLQISGKAASLGGSAPSGDLSGVTWSGFLRSESGGLLVAVQAQRGRQLEDRDVVIEVALSEAGVLRDGRNLSWGSTALECAGSGADLDVTGSRPVSNQKNS